MGMLFIDASFNEDISNWNTSNVIDMSGMFLGATKFNQSIKKWNTSKVVDMSGMFHGAILFDQSLNTSNKITINGVPYHPWNVSKVTNMSYMFKDTSFNQSIDKWNTSKVDNHLMVCLKIIQILINL